MSAGLKFVMSPKLSDHFFAATNNWALSWRHDNYEKSCFCCYKLFLIVIVDSTKYFVQIFCYVDEEKLYRLPENAHLASLWADTLKRRNHIPIILCGSMQMIKHKASIMHLIHILLRLFSQHPVFKNYYNAQRIHFNPTKVTQTYSTVIEICKVISRNFPKLECHESTCSTHQTCNWGFWMSSCDQV